MDKFIYQFNKDTTHGLIYPSVSDIFDLWISLSISIKEFNLWINLYISFKSIQLKDKFIHLFEIFSTYV